MFLPRDVVVQVFRVYRKGDGCTPLPLPPLGVKTWYNPLTPDGLGGNIPPPPGEFFGCKVLYPDGLGGKVSPLAGVVVAGVFGAGLLIFGAGSIIAEWTGVLCQVYLAWFVWVRGLRGLTRFRCGAGGEGLRWWRRCWGGCAGWVSGGAGWCRRGAGGRRAACWRGRRLRRSGPGSSRLGSGR
jgi:hypothetical protein